MRLIDADALRDTFQMLADDDWNQATGTTWGYAFDEAADVVDTAPTIDPVKHGRWIVEDGCVCCSECGEPNMEWRYCPNCGAYMQEGEEDDMEEVTK